MAINKTLIELNNNEKDQRRINLLNDPNYGIILCFLDKFRSILDLPNYPLQRFEDHLINYENEIPPRLIDFHFILLKRLSLAKNAQRDKFDSIITKFISRYDINDSEHLLTNGYLQADINIKIRILKNLFECQFDLNPNLKNFLSDESSHELKSLPLGRDRFGASYWFFMDKDCFLRLFREDCDMDRTWTNIAKNRDELEKFIKLLITDSVVRTRFSDWIIDYEEYSLLPLSNEFELCYSPVVINIKQEEEIETIPIKKKRGRPKGSIKSLNNKIDIEIEKEQEEEIEPILNTDGKPNTPIKRKRGRPPRNLNNKINTEIKTSTCTDSEHNLSIEENNNDEEFKIDDYQSQYDETSMDDVCLAVRRSSRPRKPVTIESVPILPTKPISQLPDRKKKRTMNNNTKISNDFRRRRKPTSRRNFDDRFCLSTSSSEEYIDYQTEDEYNSDDYLPNQSQIDVDDSFFEVEEEEEDNNITNNEQFHPAKTAQTSTIITSCRVCLKSDRPDVLLLCDDCNDAYHFECLRPIILSLPNGNWFCPLCEHKKLSNNLIEKLKELLINFNKNELKQFEYISKKILQRKIKIKKYNSDESQTASESEREETITNGEESILSTSQLNENSNLSSSYYDDNKTNISQRGRHRRTRFDMKQILHDYEKIPNVFDTDDDDEYIDDNSQITNFNLQLPKKITRLLHRRERSLIKTDQQTKTLIPSRLNHTSMDINELNEQLGSPLVYVNSDGNSRQIKSVITNSKQTLKIVRRWNDVQRRSRLKAINMKISNDTLTSDYADENSGFCPDDTSLSNDSNHIKDDDNNNNNNNTIIHSKINLIQPTNLGIIDKCSSKNIIKKSDANFDQLTRDIQLAVNEAYLVPCTTKTTNKTIDQQHDKRNQKKIFSPYMTKTPFHPHPLYSSELHNNAYNIFKSKEVSISNTTDLSNIILTPSSSTSLLDTTNDQIISTMNT